MDRIITSENQNLEETIDYVTKLVANDMEIVENKEDIGKWSTLPELLKEDEETEKYIIEFLNDLDESDLSLKDKVIYFINLSSFIVFKKLDIKNYSHEELNLMINYFYDKNISNINNELDIISNKELLDVIRNKVLEDDSRIKMLDYVCFMYNNSTITENNFNAFMKEMIKDVVEKDYYELVKKTEE